MTAVVNDDTIRLADGRRVGLARHGVAGGIPVLVAHETPASRLGHEFLHSAALERGIGIVCRTGRASAVPTRPDRTIAQWADDAAGIADALGIGRFAVLGYSAGGAYAIATAALLPGRVTTAATMAGTCSLGDPRAMEGLSPTDVRVVNLVRKHERAACAALWAFAQTTRRAPKVAFR